MTAGLEGLVGLGWVTSRLLDDPALVALLGGADQAPTRITEGAYDGPADLWVTITVVAPEDVKVVGSIQVMSRMDVDVVVRGRTTTYTDLIPAYGRVHARLESQQGQPVQGPAPGLLLTSERVSGIQFPERANGVQYRHLGGTYRIHAQ